MTVHIHSSVDSIGTGSIVVSRDDPRRDVSKDTERTWAVDADQEIEQRLIKGSPWTAAHAAGVPLTPDEKLEAEQLKAKSTSVVGELVGALVDRAETQVREAKRQEQSRRPKRELIEA